MPSTMPPVFLPHQTPSSGKNRQTRASKSGWPHLASLIEVALYCRLGSSAPSGRLASTHGLRLAVCARAALPFPLTVSRPLQLSFEPSGAASVDRTGEEEGCAD